MKKADIIFALAIIIAAFSCFGILFLRQNEAPGQVEITVSGTIYGVYELSDNQEFDIPFAEGGFNHVVIREGIVSVTEADCPDQLCVKQKSISRNGEAIICLPHQLSITITDGVAATIDAIAN